MVPAVDYPPHHVEYPDVGTDLVLFQTVADRFCRYESYCFPEDRFTFHSRTKFLMREKILMIWEQPQVFDDDCKKKRNNILISY